MAGFLDVCGRSHERKRVSFRSILAEGEELSSNPLCVRFQWFRITYHLANLCGTPILQGTRTRAGAACNAVFDPDLEQGGDNIVVVRRDPASEGIRLWPMSVSGPRLPCHLRSGIAHGCIGEPVAPRRRRGAPKKANS